MNLRTILMAAGIFLAAAVPAHEFWMSPTDFAPAAGEAVGVRLEIGEPFRGEAFPRDPEHSLRFVVIGADGREELIEGVPHSTPAGIFRAADSGPRVLAYASRSSQNALPHGKFLAYLEEEGYPAMADRLRGEKHPADRVEREEFTRCAKSLIGALPESGEWTTAGLALEIVPVGDPTAGRGEATFRVLADGKPLADAPFFATAEADRERRLEFRTDADGKVTVPIDRDGPWLVTSIMIAPHPDKGVADWQSHWSSLTFSVREGATTASPAAPPRQP